MRFLKDLLYTDGFLIKGHVNSGEQRLSNFLKKNQKHFLEVEEATLIRHDGGDRIHASWMQVRIPDILFAHESEDTGDDILRNLAERNRDEIRMTAYFNSATPLQISGKAHKRIFDPAPPRQHDFIVVTKPEFTGLAVNPAPEYETIAKLPYVIVNKTRLAFLFQ